MRTTDWVSQFILDLRVLQSQGREVSQKMQKDPAVDKKIIDLSNLKSSTVNCELVYRSFLLRSVVLLLVQLL